MLNAQPIDILFLEFKGCADAGLLKYTHEHFKKIQIVLAAESGIEDAISIIKKTHFSMVQKPFALQEVRSILAENYERSSSMAAEGVKGKKTINNS